MKEVTEIASGKLHLCQVEKLRQKMQNDVNFRIRSAHMADRDCQDQGTMPQRGKVAKGNS